MKRLLALTLAVGLGLSTRPERAVACSCDNPDAAEALANADTAFLGSVVEAETGSSGGAGTTSFAVETVYKGEVSAEAVVHSLGMCGTRFDPMLRYVVFAYRPAAYVADWPPPEGHGMPSGAWGVESNYPLLTTPMGGLATGLCRGNFAIVDSESMARAASLGPGHPPIPAAEATEASARVATAAAAVGWTNASIATRSAWSFGSAGSSAWIDSIATPTTPTGGDPTAESAPPGTASSPGSMPTATVMGALSSGSGRTAEPAVMSAGPTPLPGTPDGFDLRAQPRAAFMLIALMVGALLWSMRRPRREPAVVERPRPLRPRDE